MNVRDFQIINPAKYPDMDPRLFQILEPIEKTIKSLVLITQNLLSVRDNLNSEILEVGLVPGVQTTINLNTLRGVPLGAFPILIDYPSGTITGWGVDVVDESRLNVTLTVSPAITSEVVTRIWVIGA